MKTVISTSIGKCVLFLTSFHLLSFAAYSSVAVIPDANMIVSAGDLVVRTVTEFYAETLPERISFAYHRRFIDDRRKALFASAARGASAELKAILDTQFAFRGLIENYPGDDWQSRFEQTGLWNRIRSDIANTILFKGDIDYLLATAESQLQSRAIVSAIIEAMKSDSLPGESRRRVLVMAKALSLSGQRQRADELLKGIDGADEIFFEAAVLRLEISDANQADVAEVYNRLADSECRDNFELNARLAFLSLRNGSADKLRLVFEAFPQSRFLLADCVVEKMTISPQAVLPGEIALVLACTAFDSAGRYNDFILKAVREPSLRSAGLFLSAGRVISSTEPSAAIQYYLSAFRMGDAEAGQLAASLALKSWQGGSLSCDASLRTVEEYIEKTSAPRDDIYYGYTLVLRSCGQKEKAFSVLKKIAAAPHNRFSCQGTYELLLQWIDGDGSKTAVFETVLELISRCPDFGARIKGFVSDELEDMLYSKEMNLTDQRLVKVAAELANRLAAGSDAGLELTAIEFESLTEPLDDIRLKLLESRLEKISKSFPQDSLSLLRARGMLAVRAGNYDAGYQFWTQFLSIIPAESRSSQWYAGRYYQLLCLSRSSLENSSKAFHAADVLLSSYDDIAPFWRDKLALLAAGLR